MEKLKESWLKDPCWDIYKIEGFEEYYDELKVFQEEYEKKCEEKYQKKIEEENRKAEKLGLGGLYRMILSLQEEIFRQQGKISELKTRYETLKKG